MHTSTIIAGELTSSLATGLRALSAGELIGLDSVCPQAWTALAGRAIEPNVFFHPAWSRAVSAHADTRSAAQALLAWEDRPHRRLIGLLPVASAWRALRIPVPVLVASQAFSPLSVPLLDRDAVDAAARGLLEAAARAGAVAVLFPAIANDFAAAQAIFRVAADAGPMPQTINAYTRAMLDATQMPEDAIKSALGAKKLKELRRQRNRLADAGDVTCAVASSPAEILAALDGFLKLEASGWKGKRGTALATSTGNTEFVRRAVSDLALAGSVEILTLARNGSPVAAAILLKHGRRAFFFKIAYDETAAKMSPGVQLCLDVTRHLCNDPGVDDADSTAVANHPMIDHVWRGRLPVADVLVPTVPGNAASFHSCAAIVSAYHAARQTARRIVHALRPR